MKKRREDKVIERAEHAIVDLQHLYANEGIAVTELQHLLNEYKKLKKKVYRTIQRSDVQGKNILDNNDKLQENIDYTVKLARKKIMKNVAEHRKTKEAYQQLQNQLKNKS